MIVYNGSVEDVREVIQFFRFESPKLKALRKVIISPERTAVLDVNRDTLEFPGLTYGSAVLEELLRELGVVFTPAALHNPKTTPSGVKEFDLSSRYTWGHDRIL